METWLFAEWKISCNLLSAHLYALFTLEKKNSVNSRIIQDF